MKLSREKSFLRLLLLVLAFSFNSYAWGQHNRPSQIHISYGTPPTTEMTIMWRTKNKAASPQVKYGVNASLSLRALGTSMPTPNHAGGYIHTVAVSSLKPATEYVYQCGDPKAGWSSLHRFKTADDEANRVTIAAFGDIGTNKPNSYNVLRAVDRAKPDLVLLLGDLSYANGKDDRVWDEWFDLISPVAAQIPVMSTMGNHELIGDDANHYFSRFHLPNDGKWYSFTIGNIHYTCLDSNTPSPMTPGSEQFDWVVDDLSKAANNPEVLWKIAYFHHPPFTSGRHHPDDGLRVRENLISLFDAYHVDLVLCGHLHHFERCFPLSAGARIVSTDPDVYKDIFGTVYVTAGTGGKSRDKRFQEKPPWSAVRFAKDGFTKIIVDTDNLMRVEQISTDGNKEVVEDSFQIIKDDYDSLPPTLSMQITPSVDGYHYGNERLHIQVSPIDNQGVTHVELLVDGKLISTDKLAPFEFYWDAVAEIPGNHAITLHAYDLAGNQGKKEQSIKIINTKLVKYIQKKDTWRYHDKGLNLGRPWRFPGYDFSSWNTGKGLLGYGRKYIDTELSSGPDPRQKFITSYFVKEFNVRDRSRIVSLKLSLSFDDGVVAYLNGVEVTRENMPESEVNYLAPASSTTNANIDSYHAVDVSKFVPLLSNGSNLLAIEVHQRNGISDDLTFDAMLTSNVSRDPSIPSLLQENPILPKLIVDVTPSVDKTHFGNEIIHIVAQSMGDQRAVQVEFLINDTIMTKDTLLPFEYYWDAQSAKPGEHVITVRGYDIAGNLGIAEKTLTILETSPVEYIRKKDIWKVYDKGHDLGSSWRSAGFDRSDWMSGKGVLGYGHRFVNTRISYGSNTKNKNLTSYFVKKFKIGDVSRINSLKLQVAYDEGYVAYLNGSEIARANMPDGHINYLTCALKDVDAEINPYPSFDVSNFISLLSSGSNLLAIEVHQQDVNSQEKIFDAALSGQEKKVDLNNHSKLIDTQLSDRKEHPAENAPTPVEPPAVGVYYYPWFSQSSWDNQGYLRDLLKEQQQPLLGEYDTKDPTVIQQHINWCKDYKIDFLCVSWSGENTRTGQTIREHLAPAIKREGGDLSFCIHYESRSRLPSQRNSIVINSEAENILIKDFASLLNNYGNSPHYLKIRGRPVIVLYLSRIFSGEIKPVFDRVRHQIKLITGYDIYLIGDEVYWGAVNTEHMDFLNGITAYNMHGPQQYAGYDAVVSFTNNVFEVFNHYKNAAETRGISFIPNVLPGFNDRGVRLEANHYILPRKTSAQGQAGTFFQAQLDMARNVLDENLNLILVTSFNEWYEDSQIEPATGPGRSNTPVNYTHGHAYEPYGTLYLEQIRRFKESFIAR